MMKRFKNQGEKDLAGVLYNRGTRNARNGNLNQAIEDFTRAIEIKPDDIMAYNNRGSAYAQQGDYIQAISDFTKAIGLNPNDPVAYHNRAVAYFGLKQYDKAWGDVNMVKEIGATVNPEVLKMLKEVTGK
jgi:tetratricopeptide (TPR) repeat protein